VRKNTIKIRFRPDEINLTPFLLGHGLIRNRIRYFPNTNQNTRYLESDPKNYLLFHKTILMSFEYFMHSQEKCVFKNELQFVSKLMFLVSNFLRESKKSYSDQLLYHLRFL